MLADDELDELAADIKERGLLQPIVLDADDAILDGRNRYAACEKAGIKPTFETHQGDDPDGYALAINKHRRHMRRSALQLITEEVRRRKAGLNSPSQRKVADEAGFDHKRLVEAAAVLDYAPYLREKIMSGGMSIQDAAKEARTKKREPDMSQSPSTGAPACG